MTLASSNEKNTGPTPGPWKTVRPGHGHKTPYLCVQIGEDDMYTTLELRPEDARLIAAAPELLELVNFVLACEGNDYAVDDQWVARAEATIAKAEGRAS